MEDSAFSVDHNSNIKNKKGDCSTIQSSNSTTPLFQVLTEKFKAVVFEKD